jgi:hypothetical protein
LSKKPDPVQNPDSRTQLEQAALILCRPQEPRYRRVEALGTLLSAYALGSRTAKRGLEEYQRQFPGWQIPDKEKAMEMASDAFQEAEALKAVHRAGDTRPGY